MGIKIEAPPPTETSLEAALEEFTDRVRLRNEQAARELIERLKERLKDDLQGR